MDYFVQKLFEAGTQKYTPEQTAAILDGLVSSHNYLAKICYIWGLIFIAAFAALFILAIRSELNCRKLRKDLDGKWHNCCQTDVR